jgi:hypothetical protein
VRLIEILASLFVLRGLVAFGVDVMRWFRVHDAEIALQNVGERVSETTRRKLAEPAPVRAEFVRGEQLLRSGTPERRRA